MTTVNASLVRTRLTNIFVFGSFLCVSSVFDGIKKKQGHAASIYQRHAVLYKSDPGPEHVGIIHNTNSDKNNKAA